jgi:lysyl-tRNA synthetase class 2
MVAVFASSVIREIDYDAARRELTVSLASGKVYIYRRVPPKAFAEFAAARSKGAYFNEHIRDKYFYVEPDEMGPPAPVGFRVLKRAP